MKRIPLTQGKFSIVDDDDFEWLSKHKWTFNGYCAYRKVDDKNVYMHREIMKTPKGMDTDHKNHNRLDNKKENLRIATRSQNSWNKKKMDDNTSGYKGISKKKKKWRARICVDGNHIYLGYYATKIEAALAYDNAARKYHGEFAYTNFEDDK